MATPGPKPKPVEQAKRDGTRPARIPNPPLRSGPTANLETPEDFNSDQIRAWKQLVGLLTDLDVLDSADIPMLETAAAMLGRMREARRELLTADMIEITQRGAAVPSPWWKIEREASLQLTKLLAELGLSPSARAKLANGGTRSQKQESTLDDLLGEPGRLKAVNS